MKTQNEIAQVLERMLPVGSIVEWAPVDGDSTDLSTPEKVAAYYGFGTWEAYGSGRMLLGVSGSHAIGSTGGSENVTLTEKQLPKITGQILSGVGGYLPDTNGIGTFRSASGAFSVSGQVEHNTVPSPANGTFADKSNYQNVNFSIGNGQSHTNMPPYITIYRWRRTA